MKIDQRDRQSSAAGSDVVRFRVVTAPSPGFSFIWGRKEISARCNLTRAEAASLINNEIGVDNLISVTESNWGEYGFAISIWYREDSNGSPKQRLGDFD